MILRKVNSVLTKNKVLGFQIFRFTHDAQTKVLYPLKSRRLLQVGGPDATEYLQGLITNDMRHFSDGATSIYAMFLNNKGRLLYDTLIHKWNEHEYMLECDKNIIALLDKHLKVYKLKRKVDIKDISPLFRVWALVMPVSELYEAKYNFEKDSLRNINIYQDPRIAELGFRLITTTNIDYFDLKYTVGSDTVFENDEDGYKYLRYRLGVSEGAEDLFPGTNLPLEANCDYLHGVSFHKGCYIGQELTARVFHTGVVRKRIMPLKFTNMEKVDGLDKDNAIMANPTAKSSIGKLKGYIKDYGIGLLKTKEALEARTLQVGKYTVEVIKPSWWPVEAPREKLPPVKPAETAMNEA